MPGIVQRKRLRQAIALKDQGRLDDAEQILMALVAANPNGADAWLELGNVRLGRGEARLAFEAFDRAAGFLETAAEAHTALGRLATPGPGDHIRHRNFRQALLVGPSYVPALADLTGFWSAVARQWFVIAAAAGVGEQDPFNELVKRGKFNPAIQLARMALIVRPDRASMISALANLVFRLEDLEAKAKYLQQSSVLLPSRLDILVETAAALFQTEDLDGAERYVRRALDVDSNSAVALFWLGRIQRHGGAYEVASETFAEALRHDDGFALRIRVVEQGINPTDLAN
jgi:tetratricopeptide (TPR) repeat protein